MKDCGPCEVVVGGEQWECCALFGHVGVVSSQHSTDTAAGPEEQSGGKEGLEPTGIQKTKTILTLFRERAELRCSSVS